MQLPLALFCTRVLEKSNIHMYMYMYMYMYTTCTSTHCKLKKNETKQGSGLVCYADAPTHSIDDPVPNSGCLQVQVKVYIAWYKFHYRYKVQ